MKRYLTILILFIFAGVMPAKADYIATHTFYVNANNTISIVVSGTLAAAITGMNGILSTPLNVNFNITTNEDVDNIRLRAYTTTATSSNYCCCCTTSTGVAASHPISLALADGTHLTDNACIADCLCAAPTYSLNPNSIAYPGTVSINNNGTIEPMIDGQDHYMNVKVKIGVSDLLLTLSTTPISGTYDLTSSLDEADNYILEVLLDNIP